LLALAYLRQARGKVADARQLAERLRQCHPETPEAEAGLALLDSLAEASEPSPEPTPPEHPGRAPWPFSLLRRAWSTRRTRRRGSPRGSAAGSRPG
jgi:hypothetical protein